MSTALIALMLLTSAPQTEPAPGPTENEPRGAAFIQPLITVVGLPAFRGIGLSLGSQLLLTDDWSLTADAAMLLFATAGSGEDIRSVTSGAFSLGPTYRLKGSGLAGLFLTPKVYGVVASSFTDRGPSPILGTNGFTQWFSGEFGIATDLALQWTDGRFFIGTVLGIGVGLAFGSSSLLSTFTSALWGGSGGGTGAGVVVSVNLHLLRVGFTF